MDTETLDEFKGAVNRWLLPRVAFSSVFRVAGACGVAKQFINNFVFPSLACASGFNNNNNNNALLLLLLLVLLALFVYTLFLLPSGLTIMNCTA